MTRKHFRAFAEAIANLPNRADRLLFTLAIVPTLRAANDRFNESKFREAARAEFHEFEKCRRCQTDTRYRDSEGYALCGACSMGRTPGQ